MTLERVTKHYYYNIPRSFIMKHNLKTNIIPHSDKSVLRSSFRSTLKSTSNLALSLILVCTVCLTSACGSSTETSYTNTNTNTNSNSKSDPKTGASNPTSTIQAIYASKPTNDTYETEFTIESKELPVKEAEYDISGNTGEVGVRVLHVDDSYIYFYDSYALFFFGRKGNSIERCIDLSSIGCDNPDGKKKIKFISTNGGEEIYILNENAHTYHKINFLYLKIYGQNTDMNESDFDTYLGDGEYAVYEYQNISKDGAETVFYDEKDKEHKFKFINNKGKLANLAYSIDDGKPIKIFR